MKKFIALVLFIVMLASTLCSCEMNVNNESISNLSEGSVESPASSAVSEDDLSIPSEESAKIEFEFETDDNQYILFRSTVESEWLYYSQYGEHRYLPMTRDGIIYSVRIKEDNYIVDIYPQAFNVYEKDGAVYGIHTEGEAYSDYIGKYCRFYDDKTYEVIFDVMDVFYHNGKVYFYDNAENATALCCANIDGTDRMEITSELPSSIDNMCMLFYDDHIICESDKNSYKISPDGNVKVLFEDNNDLSYDVAFVNKGFLYYTARKRESLKIDSDKIYYSLRRIPLDGGDSELLLSVTTEDKFYGFKAVPFGGKLLVFLKEGVYVYSDNFTDSEFYEYKDFKIDEIDQLSVKGDFLAVTLLSRRTLVYDTEGNAVFDTKKLQTNPVPEDNIVANPILFFDTTDETHNGEAVILGAFNNDGFYTTYDFPYNGKRLDDYIENADGVTVESNIIDTSEKITFYDRYGSFFDALCDGIKCYSEPIIGEAHVCTEVKNDVPFDSRRFLGTYSGVDILPKNIEYSGDSITVDLDSDGDDEVIRWSFEQADGEWDGYYYYTLDAVIDGKTVVIADNNDWVPLLKSDFEVFIADVNSDGIYEVLVYEKAAERFNNISIYKVSAEKSNPILSYTITPEP